MTIRFQNATAPEVIPTYEGSNQATHPSVIRFDEPWHGYRYWMAMTPYPNNDDGFEDPSVLASENGRDWIVPDGVVNPLAGKPEPGHNCDTELVYDPGEDELRIYYVEADDVKQSWVKLLRSKDGIHWTGPETVIHDPDAMYGILSPAIVRYPDGSYQMWYVDTGNTGYRNQNNRVKTRTSADGLDWGHAAECEDLAQPGHQIWHMTIQYYPDTDEYIAIYPAYPDGTDCDYCKLFFARKTGSERWCVLKEPVMEPGKPGSWDDFCLYRTSFIKEDDTITLWYGGKRKEDSAWGIGRSVGKLA